VSRDVLHSEEMTAARAARTCAEPSRRHSISLLPAPHPAGSYSRRFRTAAFFFAEASCAAAVALPASQTSSAVRSSMA
jgi:hypothetical protein